MKTFNEFIKYKSLARQKQVARVYGLTEQEQEEVIAQMKAGRKNNRSKPVRLSLDQ